MKCLIFGFISNFVAIVSVEKFLIVQNDKCGQIEFPLEFPSLLSKALILLKIVPVPVSGQDSVFCQKGKMFKQYWPLCCLDEQAKVELGQAQSL